MKQILLLTITILSLQNFAWAQANSGLASRVNLEDVNIQGEANKNGGLFQNRDRFELDNRVKARKDFRSEINDLIPENFDKLPDSVFKK